MHCNPCAQCRKLKFYLDGVINASLSGQLYGSCGQSSMIIYEMESLASSYVPAKRQVASFCARLLPHSQLYSLDRHRIIVSCQIANLNISIWISPNLNIFKTGTKSRRCTTTLRYLFIRDRNVQTYVSNDPRIVVKQCVCNDGRGLNNSVTRTHAGMSDT